MARRRCGVRLEKNRSAVLVVDVQERLTRVIDGREELERRLVAFLEGAVTLGLPLLWAEQYVKGLGDTVAPVASVLRQVGISPVEKLTFSCCDAPEIAANLDRIGPQSVLVTGIETHVCVLQTCLDLVARGHTTFLVCDCTGSRHATDREIAIRRLQHAGVVLCTAESALFELLGAAGSDEFRAISRIVKPL